MDLVLLSGDIFLLISETGPQQLKVISYALEISSLHPQKPSLSQILTITVTSQLWSHKSIIWQAKWSYPHTPMHTWLFTPCKSKAPLPRHPLHSGLAEFRFSKWKVTLYSPKRDTHCWFEELSSSSLHLRFDCTLYFIYIFMDSYLKWYVSVSFL